MEIAVVIPTLNRAETLRLTLESLSQVSGIHDDTCQILIVDNGSTDSTRDVVSEARSRFHRFCYIDNPNPGLHTGRNLGWQSTTADVVAYLDDDVLLSERWLAGVRSAFKDPAVLLAGGPILPAFQAPVPNWLMQMWDKQPLGDRILGELSILDLGVVRRIINPFQVFGCNFLVRKRVLEEAQGFHPDGMPQTLLRFRGDGESYVSALVKECGGITCYEPDAAVWHQVSEERTTVDYFERRWFAQGISDSYTDIRNRQSLKRRIKRALITLKHLVPDTNPLVCYRGLQRRFRRHWARGYLFHHWACWKDPLLREWVRQPNYLGTLGRVPQLKP